MKRIVLMVLALLAVPAARAQVAVFGTLSEGGFDRIPAGRTAGLFAPAGGYFNSNSGSGAGFAGGLLLDIPNPSRYVAGLDLRGSFYPGTVGGSMFTASLRLAFIPRENRLRPYLLFGGGVVSGHTPTYVTSNNGIFTETLSGPSLSSSNGVFSLGGGLDIRLTRRFDLRAFDLNTGIGSNAPSTGSGFLGTTYTGYGGVTLVTFSSGVVYHLGGGHARR